MSRRLKAMAGEELPALLFSIVMIMLFISFTLMSYTTYYSNAGYLEGKRAAGTIAEKVFFDNKGILEPATALSYAGGNVKVVLSDTERGITWTNGTLDVNTTAVSSLAVLVYNSSENSLNPGRLEIHVGT